MLLGSIDAGKIRIDVHANMGPKERADKKDGIVRPLSFRIWSTEGEKRLIKVIDFEQAYFQGQLISTAIGESIENGHLNHGMLKADSDFDTILARVQEALTDD